MFFFNSARAEWSPLSVIFSLDPDCTPDACSCSGTQSSHQQSPATLAAALNAAGYVFLSLVTGIYHNNHLHPFSEYSECSFNSPSFFPVLSPLLGALRRF